MISLCPQNTCRLIGQTPIKGVKSWSSVPQRGRKPHCSTCIQGSTNGQDSPFQHPGIDFPGKAEECDPPLAGAHTLVPLVKDGNLTPFLPSSAVL